MCAYISLGSHETCMNASQQDYEESLSYLRTKLALPEPEVDRWLNNMVDKWIAARKTTRQKRRKQQQHG